MLTFSWWRSEAAVVVFVTIPPENGRQAVRRRLEGLKHGV